MPVVLREMNDSQLETFIERSRNEYVHDLTASGTPELAAAAHADEQLSRSFPGGRPGPGNHVCAVMEHDRQIGYVWFGPETDASDDRWWLFDVAVEEPERGRGVGREVLTLVEAEIRRLHGTSLGLSVFGFNDSARRLYERSGYEVVSVLMRKLL